MDLSQVMDGEMKGRGEKGGEGDGKKLRCVLYKYQDPTKNVKHILQTRTNKKCKDFMFSQVLSTCYITCDRYWDSEMNGFVLKTNTEEI